ncbi:polyprenyl synthetase family protein [Microbacterium sp. Mu-80]|uniref:Polyprenyl synthetase family protein n=1 Tax=Microbacterium bandirmense TaxID=3122050 RepID=A0ABU8LE18_9MICO
MSEVATAQRRAPVDIHGVDARLREVMARARMLSGATTVGEQLWDALQTMASGGKRIRPRMLIDAHTALGGTDSRAAVDAACAVELLHIALLIHDDVIDKDLTRRGELNITGRFAMDAMLRGAGAADARGWGEASAILAGDLALTMAHSVLARLDVDADRRRAMLDVFERAVHESAAGEQQDVWLSLRLEQATPRDVLHTLEQKTAAYSFQAPLVLAAVLAGAAPVVIDELTDIARLLGVIYQLRDDVIGLFGDEARTGKSILSDLREGKETLLIAYARTDADWPGVASLLGDEKLDETGADKLRRVILESGALDRVEADITERCVQVNRLIRCAQVPEVLKEQLSALATACGERSA